MEYVLEEGQVMCLVAGPWWSYWCNYAALTLEDLQRVPERVALGLGKAPPATNGLADGSRPDLETHGGSLASAPIDNAEGGEPASSGGGNGNGRPNKSGIQAGQDVGGGGKERPVPTMLARRPHEMDNSSLQVRVGGRAGVHTVCHGVCVRDFCRRGCVIRVYFLPTMTEKNNENQRLFSCTFSLPVLVPGVSAFKNRFSHRSG